MVLREHNQPWQKQRRKKEYKKESNCLGNIKWIRRKM
jgi:hypothetical protein